MKTNLPSFIRKYKTLILLSLILLTAFTLRSYGRNWDEGGHMHPDERMLIMVADRISFPSALNPDFFNYGSLPIYLLRGTTQALDTIFRPTFPTSSYNGMLIVGRILSSIADVGTTLLIFLAAYLLSRSRATALFASLLYSLAFFPIQNSHFFVVDVFLTLFVTLLTVSLIWYAKSHRMVALLVMGISMGAAIATKFSALIFMPGIIISLGIIHVWFQRSVTESRTSRPSYAQGFHLHQDFGGQVGMAKLARRTNILRLRSFMLWFERSRELFTHILVFCGTSLVVFAVCMPFAFLPPSGILTPRTTKSEMQSRVSSSNVLEEYPGLNDVVHFLDPKYVPQTRFLRDIREQTRMNSDAYVFPYTLQYVTTKPYIYHIEQIVKWGLGPFIGILTIIGAIFLVINLVLKTSLRGSAVLQQVPPVGYARRAQDDMAETKQSHYPTRRSLIIVSCLCIIYGLYFLIIGRSAVKFMRYMLPLYPAFTLLAAVGLTTLLHKSLTKSRLLHIQTAYKVLVTILMVGTLLWTVAFMNIYGQQNTRIKATDWILSHIPQGKTLAVEHWDDRVPIRYGEQYRYQEMTIYELPDDKKKWEVLMQKLAQSDYVVLASNRLYTPLPKLADCTKYKVCYPLATKYYQKLFDGSLGFKKIKEFTAYPRLGPWEIVDDSADESFTVYEHPKVVIFRKS